MKMQLMDWLILIFSFTFIIYAAIKARKFATNVVNFLSAGRCAGRYILSVAQGEAATGAITLIAAFELFYKAGFTKYFWDLLMIPVGIMIALSGWVTYRYRQTRALTLAQFFEMRYSKKFRIFAGMLIWFSGVLNFGVFPGVGARFFISFWGLPSHFVLFGITISTFLVMLFVIISLALFFIYLGGMITVLVTDFWQGVLAGFVMIAVMFYFFFTMKWSTIVETLHIVSQPGQSMFNPFDISSQKDFNFLFYLIGIFLMLYGVKAWQGSGGYFTSALTAHEAKMSGVISQFKNWQSKAIFILLPLAALVLLNHPDFTEIASTITGNLESSYPGDHTLQTQMRVPAAISQIMPIGLVGAFSVVMLGFAVSTNNTYMHSWGSILVQDVICPLRKKPLGQKEHLRYLRFSILGVAVFSFLYSWLFPLKEYIWMYFQNLLNSLFQ